jgi:hypothetical protein
LEKELPGCDDYHSGWDYDFNLKFEQKENKIKVTKDFDFRTEVEFEQESFYKNLNNFIVDIKGLFYDIYPKLKPRSA